MAKIAPEANNADTRPESPVAASEHVIAGRQAIMAAAESLFAVKGYQSVSIDNIAGAAGVSRGLVHYHFHSKEDLFIELVRGVMEEFSHKLGEDMANCTTARDKVKGLLLAFLTLADSRRNLWRTGVSEASGLSEAIGMMFSDYRRDNLAIVARVLETGVADGELKACDTQFVAYCMMAIITSAALGRFLSEAGLPADVTAGQMAAFLLDGIAK